MEGHLMMSKKESRNFSWPALATSPSSPISFRTTAKLLMQSIPPPSMGGNRRGCFQIDPPPCPPPYPSPVKGGGHFFFGFITYTSPCRSPDPGIDPDGPQHLIATKNGWKQRRDNVGTPGRPADREPHLEIADGTYVDDGAGPCVIQEAGAEGGAGVGSDQGGSWDSAFYAQRACGLCPGMDIDLHNTQSSEVVAQWKRDFTSGGLVEVSGWG